MRRSVWSAVRRAGRARAVVAGRGRGRGARWMSQEPPRTFEPPQGAAAEVARAMHGQRLHDLVADGGVDVWDDDGMGFFEDEDEDFFSLPLSNPAMVDMNDFLKQLQAEMDKPISQAEVGEWTALLERARGVDKVLNNEHEAAKKRK